MVRWFKIVIVEILTVTRAPSSHSESAASINGDRRIGNR
jgi:hypothetical protein